MSAQILTTKLYTPVPRPGLVVRHRLIERLNAGLHGKLTLASAPAGFGKTTLITSWMASDTYKVAWLSLDEGDNDPVRFLTYIIAALQTIESQIGTGVLSLLESPQPPPIDSLLTPLLNELATMPHDFVLVLDDYHVLDSHEIDAALAFLIDNQPLQMHLVITTREDPRLPLARLRARGQLTEIRAADLRFTADEAAEFLNSAMGLTLSSDDIAALEQRTEGWIAGLQLAALAMQGTISMRGQQDIPRFVRSFTGSHQFVLDYLLEEVLNHQPAHVHDFLLRTSILDQMCAPLCVAILEATDNAAADTLEHIRQANLFLIPLDDERRWYRYHHLFGDLLRKRLHSTDIDIDTLHIRASSWYETNSFDVEAFQHAAAANDIGRAERLIEGNGTPLYLRGASKVVSNWLGSLTAATLDERPGLWVTFAWVLWINYQSPAAEEKLNRAEIVLENANSEDERRELTGQIAAMRAMLAANTYQTDTIIEQAGIALDHLRPDNVYLHAAITRALGIAYHFRGERTKAIHAYTKSIMLSEAHDNVFMNVLSSTGLGMVQELQTQLPEAMKTFQRVIDLVGQPPQPLACAAYLGVARIQYEWNDLDAAETTGILGVQLARQIEGIDTPISGAMFLAQVRLAHGDEVAVMQSLSELAQEAAERGFAMQQPRIAALQARILLRQGNIEAASKLAEPYDLPLMLARLHLAQGNPAAALAVLGAYQAQVTAQHWHDEHLRVLVLQAVAHHQHGDLNEALAVLNDALSLAEPGGYVRVLIDEGQPMQQLLAEAAARGIMPVYTRKILAAFETNSSPQAQPLIEPLSEREVEILALVADGLSNREIGRRLFISISTVKGHNRNIFDKLHVKRRTEAVARARELGLIE